MSNIKANVYDDVLALWEPPCFGQQCFRCELRNTESHINVWWKLHGMPLLKMKMFNRKGSIKGTQGISSGLLDSPAGRLLRSAHETSTSSQFGFIIEESSYMDYERGAVQNLCSWEKLMRNILIADFRKISLRHRWNLLCDPRMSGKWETWAKTTPFVFSDLCYFDHTFLQRVSESGLHIPFQMQMMWLLEFICLTHFNCHIKSDAYFSLWCLKTQSKENQVNKWVLWRVYGAFLDQRSLTVFSSIFNNCNHCVMDIIVPIKHSSVFRDSSLY